MTVKKNQTIESDELRLRAEEQVRKKSGTAHPPGALVEPLKLQHELQVHQVELEMQNAELRQVRDELETTLEQYTDLYDFAPVGYLTLDRNGTIRSVNLTAAALLDVERSRLLGRRFALFLAEETRSDFADYLGKVFNAPVKIACEAMLLRVGNVPLCMQVEGIATASGEECRIALIDITDRKLAEEAKEAARSILEAKGAEEVLRLSKEAAASILKAKETVASILKAKETEEVLRKSEEQLRALADSMVNLAWWANGDGYFTWYNRRWYEYTGTTPMQMEGWGWQSVHDPQVLPIVLERWRGAIAAGLPFEMEFPLRGADGRFRTFLTSAQPLKDTQGRVVQWFGTNTDVEELKQAQDEIRHRNAILSGINKIFKVALTCETEEDLGVACVEVAREITQSRFGFIGEINETGLNNIVISNPGWEACSVIDTCGHRRPIASLKIHGIYGRVISDGKSLLTNDPVRHPDWIGLPAGHPPLEAFLGVPMIREGSTIGMIAVANRPGGYSPVEQEALEALAPLVVEAFIRKKAEKELRQSEERLRFHMDNSPMGVIEWDMDLNVTRWAGESERMFGWSAEETVGRPLANLHMVFEDDIPIVEKTITHLIGGESKQVVSTNRNYTKSRDIIYCTWYNSVMTDQQGKMRSVLSKIIDITDRKRAEEDLQKAHDELELRVKERTWELASTVETLLGEISTREKAEKNLMRLNCLYTVLSETNQIIARVRDRDSLFRECCRIAVEHGGFALSWVGLLDESGNVRIVAASGKTAYLDDIRISANEEPEGEGPTGISIRKGTYYICNDFQNDPCTGPWHDNGLVHGISASASIALMEQGRVTGALTLYSESRDFFDEQHVDLLVQMGSDISYALDNLAREELRKNTEAALLSETTERLRAVEALREKEQMLIQQSRQAAMGEMIGNIAHQWRQPLNTLGLTIQLQLMHYDLGEFTREFLVNYINSSMELIQHMSRTIDDFKEYFRPEKEKVEFNVRETVVNTLSLMEGSLQNPQIKVEIIAKDDPVINGYRNEFTQVLLNILVNAKDAIAERGIDSPRVTITISSDAEIAVVTVADNAGGIPEEIIGKIFDPYFTTKGPQNGTGVGLYMSKVIIEKNMEGRLTAQNIPNGAEFRIELGNGSSF